jgi:hypothetical protein
MTISGTIEQAPNDSYYFTDVTKGDIIFRSFGSNSFSFGSGSNALSCFRVNSNLITMWANNIGFGTSNPQGLFHMYNGLVSPTFILDGGGQGGRGTLRVVSTSTGNAFQSGAQLSNDSKADIIFSSMMGTTEWMRIKGGTGNVGIGTTNPTYSLHVPNTSYLGTLTNPTLYTSNIITSSCNINIGCDASTTAVNIACGSNAQTVNIGTSSAGTVINIGGAGDTVNILGTTNYVQTTEMQVSDRLITLNKGGTSLSAVGAGFEIEEGSAIKGYIKTSTDRNSFLFRAPTGTQDLVMNLSSGGFDLNAGGFTMTSSCNIGIGTSSPTVKLDINGNTYIRGVLSCISGSDPNLGVHMFTNNQDGSSSNTYQGGLLSWYGIGFKCKNDSVTRHMFDTRTGDMWALGNAGIGTASPAAKLHINNTGASSLVRISGDIAQQQGIEFYDTVRRWSIYKPASGIDMRFNDGTDDRVTFKNGGNVGLGTTSPTQKLDVLGAIAIRNGNTTGSTSDQVLLGYANTDNFKHAIKTRHSASDGVDNAVDFYVWQASQAQTAIGNKQILSITSSGVGVGKSNPSYLLDVNGTMNASNIYINGSPLTPLPSFWTQANMGNYTGCNIGIGTSNYAAKLHIKSTGTYELERLETASATDSAYTCYTNGSSYNSVGIDGVGFKDWNRGSLTLVTHCNNSIVFGTSNTQRMIIDSNGNVGIGTTTPITGLHCQGGDISIYNGGNAPDAGGVVNFGISQFAGQWNPMATIKGRLVYANSNTNTYAGGLSFQVRPHNVNSNTSLIEALRIADNGSIGIGTTSPAYKLDVAGQGRFTGSNAALILGTTSSTDSYLQVLGAGSAETRLYAFGTDGKSYLQHNGDLFVGAINNTTTPRLYIKTTGDVGIGTLTPAQKLDVLGAAQFGSTTSNKVAITGNEVKLIGLSAKHYSVYNSNNVFSIRDTSTSVSFGSIGTTVFGVSNLNVGIGTLSPQHPFQVYPLLTGTVSITSGSATVTGSGTNFTVLSTGNNININGTNYTVSSVTSDTSLTLTANVGTTGSGLSYTTSTDKTALVVTKSGNVGIGTTTVTNKLQVAGTVAATSFSGDGASLTNLNLANTTGVLGVAKGGTGVTNSTGTGSVVLSAGPTFTGTVTAATLNATTLQQGGTAISSLYSGVGHNHDGTYLSTGGGTLSGGVTVSTSASGDFPALKISNTNVSIGSYCSIYNGVCAAGGTAAYTARWWTGLTNTNNEVKSGMRVHNGSFYKDMIIWTVWGTANWQTAITGNTYFDSSVFKPGGGSFTDTCDQRLKQNITSISGALDKVSQLQGKSFKWKCPQYHNADSNTVAYGFIAQEIEQVFPEWVKEMPISNSDEKNLVSNGNAKVVELPFAFNAYVVEAIKELKAKNEALELENTQLKADIALIKQHLGL